MKKLILKLILSLMCVGLVKVAYPSSSCYRALLSGNSDSGVHQIHVSHISESNLLSSMSKLGIHLLLKECGCNPVLNKINCGEAILGNKLTQICYMKSNWGYFLVSKDYLDNLNIIFNRWD